MDADAQKGSIAIQLTHSDESLQQLYFEQLLGVKKILEQTTNCIWSWQLHTKDEYGKTMSQVIACLPGISIYKKEEWPALITFFKNGIMGLDQFWNLVKYGFEALR